MNKWEFIKKYLFSATVWLLFALTSLAQAQENDSASEVYLSFQYQGVVGNYVTSYYKDNQFYLPVSELFSLLKIDKNVNQGTLSISGIYLGNKKYLLDFKNQVGKIGNTELQLHAEDFLIKEIDYFIKPKVFEKLFGLIFTTDFSNLTLDLQTSQKMPVIAQYERDQKRKKISRDQALFDQSFYPLQYGRNYAALDGTFLDYNLSAIYSNNSQLFTLNNAVGAELLGGDIQGNFFGAFSGQQNSLTTSGLRWRYVQRNNNLFSSAAVGQTHTEGIASRAITGIKITNKPVEPRLLFDRFPIEGNAPAQSEVELYLNNRLVDFKESDEAGNYRFLVPLTYGSTNYSVRVFTPSGQQIERNSRLQIPFDYLPPGEVDYSISGGRLQNPILGYNDRGYVGEASLSAGITNWLTATGSTEYLSDYHSSMPSFTGTLNTRLFTNYLLSASANTENFYRLTSSVVYGSGASWSLSYDYNPGDSRLYNIGGSDHLARLNLFTPFQLGEVPLNIRWASTYQQNGPSKLLRYRTDLGTRLGRLNVRFGYSDQQAGDLNFETTTASRITNSYTYSIGRYPSLPNLLRGLFIRGQLSYLPGLSELEEVEFQLSRDLLQTGRIQLVYGHNFLGGFNSLSLNITIDFNKIRSNTTARTFGSDISVTQNLQGSIGYDSYGDQLLLNNRQQVGQAGAAVRLFVDNNNDGTYQDSSDKVIDDPAIRLNRAGGRTHVKKGINYVSQLLPYYRYDIEINKGALSNPLLVPNVENFSMVTDPNQYKIIEIPFYLSGVLSGRVDQKNSETLQGLGGVRLFLESNYQKGSKRKPFRKELRTFSDGSFYTYEVPPGKYQLFVDPNQLDFLQVQSQPDTMDVVIKALAEGDFIEGLDFILVEDGDPVTSSDTTEVSMSQPNSKEVEITGVEKKDLNYEIQLASFQTLRKAEHIAKEAAHHLGGSFSVVKNTNNGLYAIRSVSLPTKSQAVETIISYHNSSYKNAALVVIKNKSQESVTRNKFIQIGAFSTQSRAEAFANQSTNQLKQETAITYNSKLDLYKVYINSRFSSNQKTLAELATIRGLLSFENAFINQKGRIQIGAFKNKNHSTSFSREAETRLQRKTSIFYDSGENLYKVEIDQQFLSYAKQNTVLKKIRQTPSPFNDAFVSALEGETSTDSLLQRAMKFTFQVEVDSVAKNADLAFLSSLTNQNNTAKLEQPERDKIVFENIATWKETENLRKKLSKISTVGHPIVILIETIDQFYSDNYKY